MNVLFVLEGKLITSPLLGTILPGITRESILRMARDEGRAVEERRLSIEEVTAGIEKGTLTEAFGAGTAAVVTPIGTVGWGGKDYVIGDNKPGALTKHIYDTLTGMQYGRVADRYGWVRTIE